MLAATRSTTKGMFAMFEACPHCGRPLKTITINLFGKEREVTCYGSCGCEESKLDGSFLEPRHKAYVRAGIPERYLGAECDLDGWDGAVESGTSLYIHGPYGPGKTHFASALARKLLDDGLSVFFVNSKHLISEIQGTYNGRPTDVLDRCFDCKVLVLDDLGKEQPTPYSISMLYEIVDTRYANRKPIVATSNFTRGELLGRWAGADAATAESIVSRLCDETETLLMDGPDRRLA